MILTWPILLMLVHSTKAIRPARWEDETDVIKQQERIDELIKSRNPEEYQRQKAIREKANADINNKNQFRWVTIDPNSPTTTAPLELPKHIKQGKAQYNIIEQRGMAMERRGTLISYNSIDLMSVIIKIPPLSQTNITANCSQYLDNIDKAYKSSMSRYNKLIIHLLQPTIKISNYKICKLIRGTEGNCHRYKKQINTAYIPKIRHKRFVAGEIMAAAALSISATALGLGIANRVQLDKLESYIGTIAEDVKTIADQLKTTNDRQDQILDAQHNILGYIADIRQDIDDIHDMLECTRLEIHYQQWFNEIIAKLEDILIYPLQGKLSGPLLPTILSPEQIALSIADTAYSMGDLLTHLPLIFYSSATVTLLEFDLDELIFKFIIAFPLLQNTQTVIPIFQIFQVGFHAQIEGSRPNETTLEQCLIFDMPQQATKKDNKWFTLKLPQDKCPIIGSFSVCPETAFELSNLEKCIDLPLQENKDPKTSSISDLGCEINRCQGTSAYTNLKGGVLIRSINPTVEILTHQNDKGLTLSELTSSTALLNLTKAKTLWVPWKQNLAAVQVHDKVIHNPTDGDFIAQLEVLKSKNFTHIFRLAQILDTTYESQKIIEEIQHHQGVISNLTLEIDESNKLLDSIGLLIRFYRDPMHYLEIPLIVVGSILGLLIIIFIFIKLRAHCAQNPPVHMFGRLKTNTVRIHHLTDNITNPPSYLALTSTANPTDDITIPTAPPLNTIVEEPTICNPPPPMKKKKTKKKPTLNVNPYAAIAAQLTDTSCPPTYTHLTTIISTDE